MGTRVAGRVLAGMVLLVVAGCGATNESTGESGQDTQTSRFATADALIEFYNETAMTGPRVNWQPILNRVYAENAEHERLVDMVHGMLALTEYYSACWHQFKSARDELGERPLAPDQHPAKIIERNGRRAIASQVQNDGSEMKIHLVEMDGEWWISAYTFEYDQHYQSLFKDMDLPKREGYSYKDAGQTVRRIARRVRNGEFDSLEQANQALARAMATHGP